MRRQQIGLSVLCGAVIGLSVFLSLRISLTTKPNAHPDEYWHADAFRYYEYHWWPPDLNSDDLSYDPAGSNRIYYGEMVYVFYGRAAAVLRRITNVFERFSLPPAAGTGPLQVYLPLVAAVGAEMPPVDVMLPLYRLLNTGLLFITLVVLACAGRRRPGILTIGLTMVCVPQIIYVYSYANSDAWGLTISIFLLVFALTQRGVMASYPKQICLGILVGLLMASKQSYWLALPFAGLILARQAVVDYGPRLLAEGRGALLRAVLVVGLVAVVFMAPWRIIYPLSQGDFTAGELAMREARAMESLKPSHPTYIGYRLEARGVPFSQVLGNRAWYGDTAWSVYGLFGYMDIRLTDRVYHLAFGLGLLNLGLTLWLAFRPGNRGGWADRWHVLAAAGTVLLCLAASLFNSWTFDYQPQGRYLFGAVGALALLLWGQWAGAPRWARLARLGSGALLLALSAFVLIRYLLLNPKILM